MRDEFSSGAHRAPFPPTWRSAVVDLASDDAAARARSFAAVARAYSRPAYAHVRVQWRKSSDDARELTQAFFAEAFERRYFASYEPGKALFRTFFKLCLDRFVGRDARDRKRTKRGGKAVLVDLDFEALEAELGRNTTADVEATFDREWARSVLSIAVEKLREACRIKGKDADFALFKSATLDAEGEEAPTYAALAKEHGLSISLVTNRLSALRKSFRSLAMDALRELSASEEEFQSEARALFGIAP